MKFKCGTLDRHTCEIAENTLENHKLVADCVNLSEAIEIPKQGGNRPSRRPFKIQKS